MAIRLILEGGQDRLVLYCDVCGLRMNDPFGDQVSGNRGVPGDLTFRHASCPAPVGKPHHADIRKFFFILGSRTGIAEYATSPTKEKICMESDPNPSFE